MILSIFGKQSDPRPVLFTNTVSINQSREIHFILNCLLQWIGKCDKVSFSYLVYRWSVAILVTAGLLQSIFQNTNYFLDHQQSENVYKYFIYLTNHGR